MSVEADWRPETDVCRISTTTSSQQNSNDVGKPQSNGTDTGGSGAAAAPEVVPSAGGSNSSSTSSESRVHVFEDGSAGEPTNKGEKQGSSVGEERTVVPEDSQLMETVTKSGVTSAHRSVMHRGSVISLSAEGKTTTIKPILADSDQQANYGATEGGAASSARLAPHDSAAAEKRNIKPYRWPMTRNEQILVAWGVWGVLLTLFFSVARVAGLIAEGFVKANKADADESDRFHWWHWLLLLVSVVFFAFCEGYRGFQCGFCPRVVARAWSSVIAPWPCKLFAPFFAMGLFCGTWFRVIFTWCLFAMIVGCIIGMQYLPIPYRIIVDAGVLVGISWGAISLTYMYLRYAVGGRLPPADPNLNQSLSEIWEDEKGSRLPDVVENGASSV